MPIISTIGRRSSKLRILLAFIYTLLILGSITMIYPLVLMISGSMKSAADFNDLSPYPKYLVNDHVLWRKYIESKYGPLFVNAEQSLGHPVYSWRTLSPPTIDNRETVELFRKFRDEYHWPREWFGLGHGAWEKSVGRETRAFRALASEKFHGDLDEYDRAVSLYYPSWATVGPPEVHIASRTMSFPDAANYRVWYELKEHAPREDWIIANPDAQFWFTWLRPAWATIEGYNAAHHTNYKTYEEVLLPPNPPAQGLARDDWEHFVRGYLALQFIHVDPSVTKNWQAFLAKRSTLTELNRLWKSSFKSFEEIPLPHGLPEGPRAQLDYNEFLKDPIACPMQALSIFGPRQAFEQYAAKILGHPIAETRLPIEQADWLDLQEHRWQWRWEFVRTNYLAVIDYLWSHGNGIRNTIIFCALVVLAQLIVNPLCAYALSRYKPRATYKIILFCMATMAFPAEVTMIPSFLLLKQLHLLNTFAALVLPAAANGFSIFLLKGFFDSLPQELYESADIDGAGEFTKFWMITMSLSKPILAVLALGAFTAAYGEFMMALVIIPDPDMWTIMVWLYQLQVESHPSVIYASLVIAAIPTMLIFLLCQNLIMRGIVVPTEK